MVKPMFQGSIPALVTPMNADKSIDFQALKDLIEWHIASGSSALVVCGTTGESASLTPAEQKEVISFTLKEAAGKIPVIAGTGGPNLRNVIAATQEAEALGVAACLIVTPYYLKTTQQGLIAHYEAIAAETNGPIILYNVPGRTGVDLLPETILRLAEIKSIIGIKEATGDLERIRDLRAANSKLLILSGDDPTACEAIEQGADGVISVTANVVPAAMAKMCEAAKLMGEDASRIQQRLKPLHQALFVEPNPIPVKYLLSQMGKIQNYLRLPLVSLSVQQEKVVLTAYQGVI